MPFAPRRRLLRALLVVDRLGRAPGPLPPTWRPCPPERCGPWCSWLWCVACGVAAGAACAVVAAGATAAARGATIGAIRVKERIMFIAVPPGPPAGRNRA